MHFRYDGNVTTDVSTNTIIFDNTNNNPDNKLWICLLMQPAQATIFYHESSNGVTGVLWLSNFQFYTDYNASYNYLSTNNINNYNLEYRINSATDVSNNISDQHPIYSQSPLELFPILSIPITGNSWWLNTYTIIWSQATHLQNQEGGFYIDDNNESHGYDAESTGTIGSITNGIYPLEEGPNWSFVDGSYNWKPSNSSTTIDVSTNELLTNTTTFQFLQDSMCKITTNVSGSNNVFTIPISFDFGEKKSIEIWYHMSSTNTNSHNLAVTYYEGEPQPEPEPEQEGGVDYDWDFRKKYHSGTLIYDQNISNPIQLVNGATIDENDGVILTGGAKATAPYVDLQNIYIKCPQTHEVYFKSTSTVNYERIWDIGDGQAVRNVMLYRHSTTNNLKVWWQDVNGTNVGNIVGFNLLVNNEWIHIVVEYGINNIKVYVNSVLELDQEYNSLPTDIRVHSFLGRSNWSDNGATLNIRYYRIYNKAITQEDVNYYYSNRDYHNFYGQPEPELRARTRTTTRTRTRTRTRT